MGDIVERLRNGYPCLEGGSDHTCRVRNAASGCLCATAADTITRLRAEVDRKDKALLAALNDLSERLTESGEIVDSVTIAVIRAALTTQEKDNGAG